MIVDKSQTVIVTAGNGRPVPVRLEINPRAKRLILRLDETRREAVAVAPSKRHAKEAMTGPASDFVENFPETALERAPLPPCQRRRRQKVAPLVRKISVV